MNKLRNWLMISAAALTVGVTTVAVYPQVMQAQEATATPDATTPAVPPMLRMGDKSAHAEHLAAALGITVEELETAQTSARAAALAQAVADGAITQEQADAMIAGELQEGMGRSMGRGFGRFGGEDMITYLADALGITVEALETAQEDARDAALAQAVADGQITQEQADAIAVRNALQEFVSPRLESAWTTAIQEAVTASILTQAQADEILSQEGGLFGRGFGGPGMGRGGMGKNGMGGRGMHGFGDEFSGGRGPNVQPEIAPEDETQSESPLPQSSSVITPNL